MLRSLKFLGCTGLVLVLTHCAYFNGEKGVIVNRNSEYLRARCIPPLMIPPGYSSSKIKVHYPVSNYPGCARAIDLTPPELNSFVSTHSYFSPNPSTQPVPSHYSAPCPPEGKPMPNYYSDGYTRGGPNGPRPIGAMVKGWSFPQWGMRNSGFPAQPSHVPNQTQMAQNSQNATQQQTKPSTMYYDQYTRR